MRHPLRLSGLGGLFLAFAELCPIPAIASKIVSSESLPPANYIIGQGDNLPSIILRVLGKSGRLVDLGVSANRDLVSGISISVNPRLLIVQAEPGDTLSSIAKEHRGLSRLYGSIWLARANGRSQLRNLQPGEILLVPPVMRGDPDHHLLGSWLGGCTTTAYQKDPEVVLPPVSAEGESTRVDSIQRPDQTPANTNGQTDSQNLGTCSYEGIPELMPELLANQEMTLQAAELAVSAAGESERRCAAKKDVKSSSRESRTPPMNRAAFLGVRKHGVGQTTVPRLIAKSGPRDGTCGPRIAQTGEPSNESVVAMFRNEKDEVPHSVTRSSDSSPVVFQNGSPSGDSLCTSQPDDLDPSSLRPPVEESDPSTSETGQGFEFQNWGCHQFVGSSPASRQ